VDEVRTSETPEVELPKVREFGWTLRPLESAKTKIQELVDGRIEVTIDHALLRGITRDMLVWWFQNMDGECTWDGETHPNYHLWHPRDHISLSFSNRHPNGRVVAGSKIHIQEVFNRNLNYHVDNTVTIDRLDETGLRFHAERAGKTALELEHRYLPSADGVIYRSRLLLGVGQGWLKSLINDVILPQQFSDDKAVAWLTHTVEEVGCFEKFLPELYRRYAPKTPPPDIRVKSSRALPARLSVPPAGIARAGLRAMKAVALANNKESAEELELLQSVQTNVLMTKFDLNALEPISASDLAAEVTNPKHRQQIIDAGLVIALIDGELESVELDLILEYSRALEISTEAFSRTRKFVHEQFLKLRFNIIRRSDEDAELHAAPAFDDLARTLMDKTNADLNERFRRLEDLTTNTLGRRYFDFMISREWPLPGEKGGTPEWLMYHDCLHVLGLYDTTPTGEAEVLAMSAGMATGDPVFAAFSLVAQHTNINPERVFAAFHRGSQMNCNLCHEWDLWADFDSDITKLRTQYGITE
jgi:tellurite resistance protein